MKEMEHDIQLGCLHKKMAKNSRREFVNEGRENLQYLYGLGRLP